MVRELPVGPALPQPVPLDDGEGDVILDFSAHLAQAGLETFGEFQVRPQPDAEGSRAVGRDAPRGETVRQARPTPRGRAQWGG